MTIEQTRLLGIEFERRVQTMIPQKEYIDKLDTETIYSFLNQYQDKYIHDIYRSLDLIPSGSKLSAHIENILQSLLSSFETTSNVDGWVFGNQLPADFINPIKVYNKRSESIIDTARSVTYILPKNFQMYIRSVSKVNSTFAYKNRLPADLNVKILLNELISQNEVQNLIETPYDSLRILRKPIAVLNIKREDLHSEDKEYKPTITIIHDRYTTIQGIRILYYKQPSYFNLFTSTPCDLPMDAFDDLVSGALDLYIQYVAGAEANKRRLDEQRKLQNDNKNNNED